jgi:hypothetical protein
MLYVVLTMPTLNKAYLLFIIYIDDNSVFILKSWIKIINWHHGR